MYKCCLLMVSFIFFSSGIVAQKTEIPDSVKKAGTCEETYIKEEGKWFHTWGEGRCPPGSKKSYSSKLNCPPGNVQTSYECANKRLDDINNTFDAARDALSSLGDAMAAREVRKSNERIARYRMQVNESFQGTKDEDKYNQKELIEPAIGVISSSSANQEVLSKRLGFYSDCVIPHFDNAVKKFGGWTIYTQKDSPLCKLKAKDKKYYPTYYNQVSSNNYPSTSYPYVIQKKRKGYRICITAMGMKAGCAKNKKEDDFTYAVGFVSDNTLPSKSLLFKGKYGDILIFIYIEADFSEEVQMNLSQTKILNHKNASIEILDSSNEEITFEVLAHF